MIKPAYWDIPNYYGRNPQLHEGIHGDFVKGIPSPRGTVYNLEPNTIYTYYASPYPFKNGNYPCYTIPPCTFTTKPVVEQRVHILNAKLHENCIPPNGDDPFNYHMQHGDMKSPYGYYLSYMGWKQPDPEYPGGTLPNPPPCPSSSYPYTSI